MNFRARCLNDLDPKALSPYGLFIYRTIQHYNAIHDRIARSIHATYDQYSDAPKALRTRAGNANRAAEALEFALAVERAGRDCSDVAAGLVECFDKKGRHKAETLTRRLVKERGYTDYQWELEVTHELDRMSDEGQIFVDRHKRQGTWVYMLATPERKAARKAARERRDQARERMKARKERTNAVLAALKERGIEATASWGKVELKLEDMEALLGLGGSN